jgi:hypothetical protein
MMMMMMVMMMTTMIIIIIIISYRIAATLYSLGTRFVYGIYVQIPYMEKIICLPIIIIIIIIIII